MATSKSKMGEPRVPKPSNQGSSTRAHVHKPDVQKSNGGFMGATAGMSKRMKPAHSGGRGVGGTGTGSHKGDSLPR